MQENERREIKNVVQSFEELKHVDENGIPYWSLRELAPQLGYTRYQYLEKAVNRAKESMIASGKNPEDHMLQSQQMVNIGSKAQREVDDIRLTQYGAYITAMNGDPNKPEIAAAQEYFAQSAAVKNKAEKVIQGIDNDRYIKERNNLKENNRKLANTLLSHEVPEDKIGIVISAGDEGFFSKSTREIKEEMNIPENRPVADFMGADMVTMKSAAQILSRSEIERHDIRGVKDTSEAVFSNNRDIRNMVIDKMGYAPEQLITGEDVKKVERKRNKEMKQRKALLDKLSSEYGF